MPTNPKPPRATANDKMKSHPMQPLMMVGDVLRFKKNNIVSDLLDVASKHGLSLNDIACREYSAEDRRQLAQLVGYSLSGYGDLQSYVDDENYAVACALEHSKSTESEVRADYLRKELNALKKALRKPMARLFEKHPDDL